MPTTWHHHHRDLRNAIPTPEVLTQDFVIRSLRRRLWKAFQEDDGETALRAYQASREEFLQWLQEEEEERQKAEEREQTALLEAVKTMGSKVGGLCLLFFARSRNSNPLWNHVSKQQLSIAGKEGKLSQTPVHQQKEDIQHAIVPTSSHFVPIQYRW
jgi:hypothetical protein